MNDLRRVSFWVAASAFGLIAVRALFSAPAPAPAPGAAPEPAPPGRAALGVPVFEDAARRSGPAPIAGLSSVSGRAAEDVSAAASGSAALRPPGRQRTAALAIEDAELVLGPRALRFDTAAVIGANAGGLAAHFEPLRGVRASAAEVIDSVALDHSVNPALIVAVLELASGSLTRPGDVAAPLGSAATALRGESLHSAAGRIAAVLNDAYYGARHRGGRLLSSRGAGRVALDAQPNAAQFAVAVALGSLWPDADPEERMAAFASVFGRSFGDLTADDSPPPIPAGLVQPPLLVPWAEGEAWHFTGGPHGSWGSGSAWGAIDFAPPSPVGCSDAPEWVIASAPGVVVSAREGQVLVDLDGDGLPHTGWLILYQHIATSERVEVGTRLAAGDRIGHPSCEGGFSTGSHVHFARRYDGEWLPAAGGEVPLVLSDWTFTAGPNEYDGEMHSSDSGERMALKRRNGQVTAVESDNGVEARARHAQAWAALEVRAPLATAPSAPLASEPAIAAASVIQSPTGAAPATIASARPGIAAPSAPASEPAGSAAPRLIVRLLLEGRRTHATGFVVALERSGDPPIGLIGRTDELGVSTPIAMPFGVAGRYDVVVRAPGFVPARVIGAPIEAATIELDFSSGGLTPLRAGDMNGDGVVGPRDAVAWIDAHQAARDSADVDGDGVADLSDFLRIVFPAARN